MKVPQRGSASVIAVLIFGALGSLILGLTCGVKIGGYVHTKLDERGQIAPRGPIGCIKAGEP